MQLEEMSENGFFSRERNTICNFTITSAFTILVVTINLLFKSHVDLINLLPHYESTDLRRVIESLLCYYDLT